MLFKKIKCMVFGHQFRVHQIFTPQSYRVVCGRCDGDWAVNTDARLMPKWSKVFEDHYTSRGITIKPVRRAK